MAAPINPKGAKSDKLWRAAILKAVKRRLEGKGNEHALDLLANKLVSEGLSGDIQAIKEIGDRLDGRSVQPNTHAGDENGGAIPVSFVMKMFGGKKDD